MMSESWDDVAETVHFEAPFQLSVFRERVTTEAEILDLGCGYGRVSLQLASAGFANVRGYDASEKMIERAKREHPQLRLRVCDVTKLPEPSQSVDAVVVAALFTSVPELNQRQRVVEEIKRVLKASGAIYGVEFLCESGTTTGVRKSKTGIPIWHFEAEELRELFSAFAGWDSWRLSTSSLSGRPVSVLQFVAYAA